MRAGVFELTCELVEDLFNNQVTCRAIFEQRGRVLVLLENHPALPEVPLAEQLESTQDLTPHVRCTMKRDADGKRKLKFERVA